MSYALKMRDFQLNRTVVSKTKLSKEEKALLDVAGASEFNSVLTGSRKKELEPIADKTFKKDKRINIRISNRDLAAIESRTSEEGIPYQTFVSRIIHEYISGSLKDLTADKSSKWTQCLGWQVCFGPRRPPKIPQ